MPADIKTIEELKQKITNLSLDGEKSKKNS